MSLTSKQIDELRAYAKDRKGELAKLINDAADTIEQLSAKLHASQMERSSQYYHGGWIPCSERLPEKDTHFYLTTIANQGLNFTTTLPDDVDVVRWDYDRRKGRNSWHWCTERTVIAWMPLPEPYLEEGEK